jgi:CheY-like chemotaxis protein
VYDVVSNMDEARRELQDRKADCIIADIGAGVDAGIAALQELRALAGPDAYIITCLDSNLTGNEEKMLKTYSDSVIRKSTHYTGRLLDEVALFLHKLKKPQKRVAPEKQQDKIVDNTLKGKKVLLADDDMRNIFSVTALLEEHGMEVITAEDGREAINMLENNRGIDIVLMDIMMPEMDGYEAMRQIRATGRYGKLPIIALTAKAMTGDREKCLQAGASDYITKPIDSGKLFSLMRVWVAQQ